MSRHRAPAEDGGLLIDPSIQQMELKPLATSPARIAGYTLPEFRRLAAAEVAETAKRYQSSNGEPVPAVTDRLVLAGHQPEFFHPGVWFKNFVLHQVARRHGVTPINLVVDNDLVKSSAIRSPYFRDDPVSARVMWLAYDDHKGDQPYEEYRVGDRALFHLLPYRLEKLASKWLRQPLAKTAWPLIEGHLDRGATFAEAVSRTRRELERGWGITNLELPVSRLAQTRAFALFVHSLLTDLPRFVDCYDSAIRSYRIANKLRSRNHPAPELIERAESLEAPLWAWRVDATHRQRLFARRVDGEIAISIQEREVERLPSDANAFADRWVGFVGDAWKVRPRALMLTLFARIALAELFIHGIGGAKYDEVTDEIIRRYFKIEPPRYAVVTATMRLPLPRCPATVNDLRSLHRELRDLEWKPEIFPDTHSRFPQLVQRKRELIAGEPKEHSARRTWFRGLQDVTRAMRPAVKGAMASRSAEEERLRRMINANEILTSREFAWVLFSESQIRELTDACRIGVAPIRS